MGIITTEVSYDKGRKRKQVWKRIERVDKETGEIISTDEIENVYYGQPKFSQIQTKAFFSLMKILTGNARLIFSMLMDEASRSTNVALVTQSDVVKRTGLSKPTVERCFVELQKVDAIKKQAAGRWMINPIYSVSCRRDLIHQLIMNYTSLPSLENNERKNQPKNKEENNASGENI